MCIKLPCTANSTVVIMWNAQEKADIQKTKVNAMKIRTVCEDKINFVLGKNEDHTISM